MNIKEYAKILLCKKRRVDMVAFVAFIERPTASDIEIKESVSILNDHLRTNQLPEAIATALSLVMADAEETIAQLRKSGSLRASRYNFQAACVAEVVKAIYDVRFLLTARPDQLIYLESVRALHRLAPDVRRLREGLVTRLQPRKKEAFKTLLVFINQLFVHDWQSVPQANAMTLEFYSKEELSEAFSTLLDLLRSEFLLSDDYWNHVDERAISSTKSVYGSLLIDAARINKFKEAETLIDGLPYRASLNGCMVTVSSIDPDVEKSVRLGYMQTEHRMALHMLDLSKFKEEGNAPPFMSDFVQSAFKAGWDKMVEIMNEPVRRFVIRMPENPKFFKLFSGNSLFLDELSCLMALNYENYGDYADQEIKINDNVSSLDIFKIQRYFRFISYMYQEKLDGIKDKKERDLLTLRSVILVFRHKELLRQIRMVLPEGNAEEVLRLLILDGARTYVDLQYFPFIQMGEHYAVAPRLVADSNLVRNIICSNKLRSKIANNPDPMQQKVVEALITTGFKVRSGFETKIGDRKYETDIFAWRDGMFFIFECKNAYHPCSPHEMRNSYDHIVTGGKQLDTRLDWLRDHVHQASLFKALCWDAEPTEKFYSGIIIANRVFHGATQGRHPVRQAHEFINVILHGVIRVGEELLKFWEGSEFQTTDLVTYLTGETIISDQLAVLQPITRITSFGYRSIGFASYSMDLEEAANQFKIRYPVKPELDVT